MPPCSGTTGVPKGVMATHKNYVAGVAGARNLLEQVKLVPCLRAARAALCVVNA